MSAALARRLGLGRLLYQTLHRPIGAVKQSLREGGPIAQRRDALAHAAMRAAAAQLPELAAPPQGPQAEISFLTGPRYWHQTVFCFASLQSRLPFRITPVIHDDGRLDDASCAMIRRVIPWARFVMDSEIEARLDRLLPTSHYGSLRERRRHYPHLRKLIDIHLGRTGMTLVADSDMLFFREPAALREWFQAPHPFYILDVKTAYGYPCSFLEELAGRPLPERVNVGLYALDSGAIDWDRVEHWNARQLAEHGPQYVQEQALTAMLLAGTCATALPREDYIVMPEEAEGRAPTAALHHYVDISKRVYFRHGWRRVEALVQEQAGK